MCISKCKCAFQNAHLALKYVFQKVNLCFTLQKKKCIRVINGFIKRKCVFTNAHVCFKMHICFYKRVLNVHFKMQLCVSENQICVSKSKCVFYSKIQICFLKTKYEFQKANLDFRNVSV